MANNRKLLLLILLISVSIAVQTGCGSSYQTVKAEQVKSERIVKTSPLEVELQAINQLLENFQYEVAFQRLNDLLAIAGPDYRTRGRIYYKLGDLHERMGAIPKAKLSYQMALNLDPEQPESTVALIRLTERSSLR